jgi:hypothetical protein
MVARFMKRLAGHFANETAVATPNGKLLSGSPAEGLAKWKKLPKDQRTRLADLGTYDPKRDPAPPPRGLILKVYARGLVRDADGNLRIYRNPKAHLTKEPGRDHLWLTEAEWKSLLPARAARGDRWTVPVAITDRICRRYLIDLVRIGGEGGPHRREYVLSQKLWLTVEAASAAALRLRLDGSACFATHGREHGVRGKERRDTFQLLGFLNYDAKKKALTRFDIVAFCPTGHFDEIGNKLVSLGVAFELSRGQTPADRVRPHSLYDGYFAKQKP